MLQICNSRLWWNTLAPYIHQIWKLDINTKTELLITEGMITLCLCLYGFYILYSILLIFNVFHAHDKLSKMLLGQNRTCHISYLSPAPNMFSFIFTFRSHFRYCCHVITSWQQTHQIRFFSFWHHFLIGVPLCPAFVKAREIWLGRDHVGGKRETNSGQPSTLNHFPQGFEMTITLFLLLLSIDNKHS